MLPIVYQDEFLAVIDKPARVHTHPPSEARGPTPYEENAMAMLRDMLGCYVFPAHRLDYATSGLLVYARSSEMVRPIMESFQRREVEKEYWAIVRGWTEDEGRIDRPLTHPDTKVRSIEAITKYQTTARVELPVFVDRYPQSRYSFLKVRPETGRRNQIRRHLSGSAHPIIGDKVFGHREHNKYFELKLGLPGLWLRAARLSFIHPVSKKRLDLQAPTSEAWGRAAGLFPKV